MMKTIETVLAQAPMALDSLPVLPIAVAVILLLVMLVVGAIMAGAEVAFFNLDIRDVNYLKSRSDRSSLNIVELIETPKTLSSVLKSVKVFCIIIGVGISIFLANTLLPANFNIWIKALILLVANIFLILLVIEIMPKVYARKNKLRLLLFAIPIITPLFLLLKNIVARNDRRSQAEEDLFISMSYANTDINLRDALEARLGHEPSEEEYHIFNGILKFGSLTVKQVMTSRMNIRAISYDYDTAQVIEKVQRARMSRMPIYRGSIDNVVGILFTKDLLLLEDHPGSDDWKAKIRTALFVPETKLIEDLFKEFQEKRIHIAIVVDEFGGTSGLVTLEDILEQVVGEISDEFDHDTHTFELQEDNAYIVSGQMGISDVQRILDIPDKDLQPFHNNQIRTISGLLLEIAKTMPKENEVFEWGSYEISAVKMDHHTILKVKIKKKD